MTKRESPQPESAEYWLGEILAVIHGDGGHYRAQHGNQKATEDAIAKWYARGAHEPTADPKRWKLMPWRVAELREQADKLAGTLNVHEIQCLRDLLSSWLPVEAKAYGPGMTPHADDCVCAVCGPSPQQFCPHCGKSEPHTHRVPGVAEPVVFPHGPSVNR